MGHFFPDSVVERCTSRFKFRVEEVNTGIRQMSEEVTPVLPPSQTGSPIVSRPRVVYKQRGSVIKKESGMVDPSSIREVRKVSRRQVEESDDLGFSGRS